MKLPEAIALMLEGKVMVDRDKSFWRAVAQDGDASFETSSSASDGWWDGLWLPINGWREATPEELKEIGL